jgi:hypothetical protein
MGNVKRLLFPPAQFPDHSACRLQELACEKKRLHDRLPQTLAPDPRAKTHQALAYSLQSEKAAGLRNQSRSRCRKLCVQCDVSCGLKYRAALHRSRTRTAEPPSPVVGQATESVALVRCARGQRLKSTWPNFPITYRSTRTRYVHGRQPRQGGQ